VTGVPERIRLSGATALVTGATGGLGRAIGRGLTSAGARVILSGRRQDALEQAAAELGAAGTIVADLAVAADVRRLADQALAAGVEVLVANAALPASGLLTDLAPDQIDRMLNVNLRAPITLARALAPEMIARRRGQMVFVSSLAGKAASPASSIYSATKFGLRGFALGLRADLRPHGVGVTVVAPGFISGVGMYARTGVHLPPFAGTRPPEAVAGAVLRAIERNPPELEVAPLQMRLGATIGSVAPGLAAWGSRLFGSEQIAHEFAERQRDER